MKAWVPYMATLGVIGNLLTLNWPWIADGSGSSFSPVRIAQLAMGDAPLAFDPTWIAVSVVVFAAFNCTLLVATGMRNPHLWLTLGSLAGVVAPLAWSLISLMSHHRSLSPIAWAALSCTLVATSATLIDVAFSRTKPTAQRYTRIDPGDVPHEQPATHLGTP